MKKNLYNVKAKLVVYVEGEIDADSPEEAINEFKKESVSYLTEDLDVEDTAVEIGTEVLEQTFRVKTALIDYDITSSDVEEEVMAKYPNVDPNSDEFDDLLDKAVDELRASLPQELMLEVKCNEDDLDDYVVDKISDITGFCVDYAEYEII